LWDEVLDIFYKVILTSPYQQQYYEYKVSVLGFSIDLQNQFRLNDELWLQATHIVEPDTNRAQNTDRALFRHNF